MKIGQNIAYYRKRKGMTQEELAEQVDVSFQTVSSWEQDSFLPQLEKIEKIAHALDVRISDLLSCEKPEDMHWQLKYQMFDIDHMYSYIKKYAGSSNAVQTASALPYAKKMHAGQYRKGNGHVPYIYHPLVMACHALALGLNSDDQIAVLLLHDVCEDCKDASGNSIQPEDLPVGKAVQDAVRLLTKPESHQKDRDEIYYEGIRTNKLAVIAKVLDRCNNLSLMASGFTRNKMREYIVETEKYVMPLLDLMKDRYQADCYNAAFLIKYQMLSDLENLKRLL